MAPDEYWYRSADGLRLFSRVFPGPSAAAPVVLCLHGLLRTGRDFEDLAPHLARRFRVIVPDIRGRGLCDRDPNPANYQIPVYIQDLLRLLRGLGVTCVRVVGTSMGGLIGMVLAVSQPGLIARLVLNDVGPEIDPRGLERIRGYAGRSLPVKTWEEAGEQLRNSFGIAWPGLPGERWSHLARRAYRADAAGILQPDADPAIGDVIRNAPAAAPTLWSIWPEVTRIPVLAVRGEISDVLSAETLERMRAQAPSMQTVVVRNRGHVPLLDEAEALAAIDAFLDQ